MKHRRSLSFKADFAKLPKEIQDTAKKQFKLLKSDPAHSSLSFKLLRGTPNYSARVSGDYRMLGMPIDNTNPTVIVWFFIGTHSDYNNSKNKIIRFAKEESTS